MPRKTVEKLKHTFPECPLNPKKTTWTSESTFDFPQCEICDQIYLDPKQSFLRKNKLKQALIKAHKKISFQNSFDNLIKTP